MKYQPLRLGSRSSMNLTFLVVKGNAQESLALLPDDFCGFGDSAVIAVLSAQLDHSNAREPHLPVFDLAIVFPVQEKFPAVSMGIVSPTRIPLQGLEPGVSRLLFPLYPPEESLEGTVYSFQGVLFTLSIGVW